jgi:flagellar hook protein FlgE
VDRSLYVAMTGAGQTLQAQSSVAHNLANANTTGFKAEMAAFQSVPVQGAGMQTRVNAVSQGLGADFSPGAETTTGRELDVAVRGQGWIAVQAPDGSEAYTRAGDLTIDASAVTQYGDTFDPGTITQNGYAPGKVTGIDIDQNGVVSARFSNGQTKALGQLALADFENAQGLKNVGNTQWVETAQSGQVIRGAAGTGDFGSLQSGALEDSNVDLTAQLVNMIKAQRNYQANAQTISADDKMTQKILNIRN